MPYQEYIKSTSISIRVNEVRNHPLHEKVTAHGGLSKRQVLKSVVVLSGPRYYQSKQQQQLQQNTILSLNTSKQQQLPTCYTKLRFDRSIRHDVA